MMRVSYTRSKCPALTPLLVILTELLLGRSIIEWVQPFLAAINK